MQETLLQSDVWCAEYEAVKYHGQAAAVLLFSQKHNKVSIASLEQSHEHSFP